MATKPSIGSCFLFPGSTEVPATRGRWAVTNGEMFSQQLLPTDSSSNMTFTLTNVVIGSRIRIEEQASGDLVSELVADTTTEVFTIPVYSAGNAKNDLRIKVRKGTAAPFYQPWETLAVATPGSQSIYVAQIPDE